MKRAMDNMDPLVGPLVGPPMKGRDWATFADLHNQAMEAPRGDFERGLVSLIMGVLCVCNGYRSRFESLVGDDHVIGPEVAAVLGAIRGLLDGEIGRLDAGTISGWLCAVAEAHNLAQYDERFRR